MYCKKCGKQIDDDSLFCTYCGKSLSCDQNDNLVAKTCKLNDQDTPAIELPDDPEKISLWWLLLLIPIFAIMFILILNPQIWQHKNDDYSDLVINNKIFSKEACIDEIKQLLQVDEIYYFDCDFSNLPDIEIVDSSYNVSVWGKFVNKDDRQVIDLSQQARVQIVANYKIVSNGTAMGFSIVSNVMTPGAKHYKNDVFQYETENEIYTKETFSSFSELKGDNGNGTIYWNGTTIDSILVPENFYTSKLSSSLNPISYYRKYSGTLYNITVEYTPLYVVTHYEDYESFDLDENFATMEKIKSYLNENAIYIKG